MIKAVHQNFIEEQQINPKDCSTQLQNQLEQWDKDAQDWETIENEGLKVQTLTSLEERSVELLEKLRKAVRKTEESTVLSEETDKNSEEIKEPSKKAKNPILIKDTAQNSTPNLTDKEQIIAQLYDKGKRELTEKELSELGISGWLDLGWGEQQVGSYTLKEKSLFSEIWVITKNDE